MTETNTPALALQEADLANMDAAAAAPLRSLRAKMEVRTQQGAEIWEAISPRLRGWIGEGDFNRWFSAVKPTLTARADQPLHLRLAFPTGFKRDQVEARYSDYVRAAWREMEPSGTLEFVIQPAEEPPPKPAKAGKKAGIVLPFPPFPTETRPVVNSLACSALFAAIQGKDCQLVEGKKIAASGDDELFYSGRELNQDDHDVFMQLVACAAGHKPGGYISVTDYSLLKALGRKINGQEYRRLDASIMRLKEGSLRVKIGDFTYFGNLIEDAVKDDKTKAWTYKLNVKLYPLYQGCNYTLIDWEKRKALQGKDLARWLHLWIARHAKPHPVSVTWFWQHSGSKNANLGGFRRDLRKALTDLQAKGHIKAWEIKNDLVHIDRGEALTASQRRSLAAPQPR